MAPHQINLTKKRHGTLILTALAGLVLSILAPKGSQAEDSPTATNNGRVNQTQPYNFNPSQIKEMAGKLLLDSQAEVTQSFQVDKYVNFVNVSTPTLTPSSGHSLLFANNGAKQFIAKFSDGSTTILGSGSGSAGTITGVTAGTDLTGGGTSGTVTLNVDPTLVLETSSATATYLQKSSATATYLQVSSAPVTYLTQSSATLTYLYTSSAPVTYLTQSSATATYLQIGVFNSSAPVTYLTQSSATATYLQTAVFNSSAPITYLTQSSATLTYLTQSSATAKYCHADGLNCTAGSTSKFVQSVSTSSVTTFSTTGNTFVATNLCGSITPTSSSNQILVMAFSSLRVDGAAVAFLTLFRNTSNLLSTSGQSFARGQTGTTAGANAYVAPASLGWLDSPSTTSKITYCIAIRNSNSSTSVSWGDSSTEEYMLMVEIAP